MKDFLKVLFKSAKSLLIGLAIFLVVWLVIFLLTSLSKLIIQIPTIYILFASLFATITIAIIYLKKAFLIVEKKTAVATQIFGKDSRILLEGLHFLLIPVEKKVERKSNKDKYKINLMLKVFTKKYESVICQDNIPLVFVVQLENEICEGGNKETLIENIRKFVYVVENPDAVLLSVVEGAIRDLAKGYKTWLDLKAKDTIDLSKNIEKYLDKTYGMTVKCKILNIEPEDPTLLATYTAVEKSKKEKEVAKEKAEAKRIEQEEEIKAVEKTIKSLKKEFGITFEEALEIVRYQDNQGILNTFAENGNTLIAQNPLQYVADLSGVIDLKKK